MVPDNHAKEFLHRAYVLAVATQAGYTCQFESDDYGADARISEIRHLPNGKFVRTGCHFSVQMKASHLYHQSASSVTYALEADAHNRLYEHRDGPIVLVLFCVPASSPDRFDQNETRLQLQHGCYWYPRPTTLTANTSSITIAIPRSQLFTPESCQTLMELARTRQL